MMTVPPLARMSSAPSKLFLPSYRANQPATQASLRPEIRRPPVRTTFHPLRIIRHPVRIIGCLATIMAHPVGRIGCPVTGWHIEAAARRFRPAGEFVRKTPRRFHPSAQGCRVTEATLGASGNRPNPEGGCIRPPGAAGIPTGFALFVTPTRITPPASCSRFPPAR